MLRPLNKAKALLRRVSTWLGDQIRIPRVVIVFFLFFPFLFQGDLLRTAELPFFCNDVSSIYQLFVPHFAMAENVCLFALSYK